MATRRRGLPDTCRLIYGELTLQRELNRESGAASRSSGHPMLVGSIHEHKTADQKVSQSGETRRVAPNGHTFAAQAAPALLISV
jgi:hypothetical protein